MTSNTNITMTTGVIAENTTQNSHNKKCLVSMRTKPSRELINTISEYRYAVSNRKEPTRLHLNIDDKTFGFDIFDDVKCFPGHQVTIVQDGSVITHVINHSTEIKMYIGPEQLHQNYTTQQDTGAIVKSLFTQFKAQVMAVLASGVLMMTAKQAGYNVLLEDFAFDHTLLTQNSWLLSIAVWLATLLISAQLIIKKSSVHKSLKSKCQPNNCRQANYFYASMSWAYPVLSFLVLSRSITMTKAAAISFTATVVFALMNYLLVALKSNAHAMDNAQGYEKTIERYFVRFNEKLKEQFMQLKAA